MNKTTFGVIAMWAGLIGVSLVGSTLVTQKINTTFGTTTLTVVEFDLFSGEIKISPNMDFANVKVTFTDLPGQSISVKELRDLIKSKPILK